jgi:hypothetical protein
MTNAYEARLPKHLGARGSRFECFQLSTPHPLHLTLKSEHTYSKLFGKTCATCATCALVITTKDGNGVESSTCNQEATGSDIEVESAHETVLQGLGLSDDGACLVPRNHLQHHRTALLRLGGWL